jgi:hypothetical protein
MSGQVRNELTRDHHGSYNSGQGVNPMATRIHKKATTTTANVNGKKSRKKAKPSVKEVNPLAKYVALLNEIDFSERGTPEELAENDLAMLKATEKMRKRANAIALD